MLYSQYVEGVELGEGARLYERDAVVAEDEVLQGAQLLERVAHDHLDAVVTHVPVITAWRIVLHGHVTRAASMDN